MTPELEQKIQAAIKDSLPSAVCAELQAVLAQAAKDAAELVSAKACAQSQRQEIQSLAARIAYLQEQVKRSGDLDLREKELEARERSIEVKLLETKLDGATKAYGQFMDLMTVAFRNPVVKETVLSNSSSGRTVNGMWQNESDTRNATVEKTVT